MIGCLRTRVRKQQIIAHYFEFENELKFYNLEARSNIVKGSCDSILDPGERFASSSFFPFLFCCLLNHMADIAYVFWCMHQFALSASSQSENN